MTEKATNIVNLTPHPIRVKATNGYVEIPPSGEVARVATSETYSPMLLRTIRGLVFLVRRQFASEIAGLPDQVPENAVLIVSSMVLEAARRSKHPLLSYMAVPDTGPTAKWASNGQIEYVTRFIVA